jgi:hypothetical protein
LRIEPNMAYKKYKESDLTFLVGHQIIHLDSDSSPVWIPITATPCSVDSVHKLCFYIGTIQDSVVGIVVGQGLDNRGLRLKPQKGQEFTLLHVVQNSC